MLKYTDAANKNREVLNKKWDTVTATEREKNKVLVHEMGVDRAAARDIHGRQGKTFLFGKLENRLYLIACGDSGINHYCMLLLLMVATKLEIICDIIISGFGR